MTRIEQLHEQPLSDHEDIQTLRHLVERAKITLTNQNTADISMSINSIRGPHNVPVKFTHAISRRTFEEINADLFEKVLEPIVRVLEDVELQPSDVDEIVLVGGSTRIPIVRRLIAEYFGKEPNIAIDPELAVTHGVSIQAGILGGMWPLNVSAIEVPTHVKKVNLH